MLASHRLSYMPWKLEVHAKGGPVFLNGKKAKLKKSNDNYYEAKGAGITVSISINPDGSPDLSYRETWGQWHLPTFKITSENYP